VFHIVSSVTPVVLVNATTVKADIHWTQPRRVSLAVKTASSVTLVALTNAIFVTLDLF